MPEKPSTSAAPEPDPAAATIVALATPPGPGAVGVIRVSGPDAIAIVEPLVQARLPLTRFPSHTVRRATLVRPPGRERLDDALVVVMRAPRSYTGEDVVELSCHGSPALLDALIRLVLDRGARLAEPGEFTRRAFLHGRLDLAQAEAVALLIGARTERAVVLAARALGGALSDRLRTVHDALVDVVAGLEVRMDFPEDDVGAAPSAAAQTVEKLCADVDRLLEGARQGRVVHEGVTVALVGPPNAGKSSLLNAIVGRERAIVSPVAGTTRDVVEATVSLDGVPLRVLDTAGLRRPVDALEAEGVRRTRSALDESDVVLVVLDGTLPPDPDVVAATAGRPRLVLRAKSDLLPHPAALALHGALAVSAVDGTGLDDLRAALGEIIRSRVGGDSEETAVVASLRQLAELQALARSLRAAESALADAPLEVALVDLRDALHHTAALLGFEVGDAVLDRIFSAFCVGK